MASEIIQSNRSAVDRSMFVASGGKGSRGFRIAHVAQVLVRKKKAAHLGKMGRLGLVRESPSWG
ncbi:hypothetical protein [Dokdonella sp.]|uniref:hypothetical protein n=1 Tax=Dokdonella sp. TaxID=2291710 RepID=UPI001B0AE08D|nr:hypothetical protein [Dokdonella sp.]MBO9661547.1 hypothetical protein [Dokdonella sp.]